MVVYEDRSADLWIATAPEGITRWNRRTNSWQVYRRGHGLPPAPGMLNIASAFGEDRDGGLWVGFQSGGVARFRNEQFELFTVSDGAPAGSITGFHVDRMGRLWIGSTESGLVRVDQPGAARPVFGSMPYGARMATTNVRCITDDAAGRIYVGTSRGVYRIDPETGRVKHFGTGEGLASDFVITAFRDARGMLWFGTISGLSRLDPVADRSFEPNEPPPVRISALRVRGVPHRVAELGDLEPKALTLTADQNQLEVEFFAVTFAAGESLKYQYRIEQVDGDWSRPSEARSVTYGRLPSGSHRLLVRAVSSNDVAGRTPAVVTFTVLPPIYARWWFIVLAGAVIGAAGLVAYRARVAQLLRVERVRARIATDLHDDIGASLSQIAILAEVARQRQNHSGVELSDSLQRIAETSRTLVDSMSDIVWAVNPDADSLGDLVYRMRRFAEDTLGGTDIDLAFRAREVPEDLRLGADVRREIYLMLKESVTNIAKHSLCTAATVDFECDRRYLRLRVTDNGKGFDLAERTDGHGIVSMQRRGAALGGQLVIRSAPGQGTTVLFEIDRHQVAAEAG
jgi:signal transduction histidine kinase